MLCRLGCDNHNQPVLIHGMQINVWVYGRIVEAKFPSLKKVVVNTRGIDEGHFAHEAKVRTCMLWGTMWHSVVCSSWYLQVDRRYMLKEPQNETEEGMTFEKPNKESAGDLTVKQHQACCCHTDVSDTDSPDCILLWKAARSCQ